MVRPPSARRCGTEPHRSLCGVQPGKRQAWQRIAWPWSGAQSVAGESACRTIGAKRSERLPRLSIVGPALALVGGLQILGGLFLSPLSVVFGADRLVVLVHGAVALAADIVNPAQVYPRPDFGPFRVEVAVQRRTELVGRFLIIILQEIGLGDAIVRQRA